MKAIKAVKRETLIEKPNQSESIKDGYNKEMPCREFITANV